MHLRRIAGGLVWLLVCGSPLHAAVAIDLTAAEVHGNTTTLNGNTLAVVAQTDRAILCALSLRDQSATVSVNAWDPTLSNQALTLIGSAVNSGTSNGVIRFYALLNPAAAVAYNRFTWSTTNNAAHSCLLLTGVDQGSVTRSFSVGTSATGTSNTPACTATSATNNLTAAAVSIDTATHTVAASDKTAWYSVTALSLISYAASTTLNGTSNTHNFVISSSGSDPWLCVPITVYATGQVPGGSKTILTLGVGGR